MIVRTTDKRTISRFAVALVFFALCVSSCARRPDSGEAAERAVARTVAVETAYSDSEGSFFPMCEAEPMIAGADDEGKAQSEEPTIPIVVPKEIEPRYAFVEPMVRVRILGNASVIELSSKKEMVLEFGANSMKIEPGQRISFKPRSARVASRAYTVGIGTFKVHEYDQAMQLAETWKKDGYTVRLIKAGGQIVQADGSIADTTVYWVALGMFKERNAAERFRDKIINKGLSPWVIDESLVAARGNIEIADAKGDPRAYANSRITVTGDAPLKLFDVPFGRGFWDSGHREDRSYPAPLEIIVDEKGMLAAINEVKLEEYVKGVVPVEIRLSAHDEALKTQAVCARTEAVAKLGVQHVYDPYDFCASQHCQEYGGFARRTDRTNRAVDATRGQVLMCEGRLVDAVYSANCGGFTEHNELVWSSRPNPALRGVSDLYSNPESFDFPIPSKQIAKWLKSSPPAYCGDPRVASRNFRWKVKYTPKEMNGYVNKYRDAGAVKDIRVLQRGVSGRALKIMIVGNRDNIIVHKELEIRRLLGGLKSSMFIVETAWDSSGNPISFVFYGGGWGHGVGMCQAGVEGMALRGFKYPEILGHYYVKTEIRKQYE